LINSAKVFVMKNKKIAIIGSGISGLGLAYIGVKNNLAVTLFEQNNYFGGHSNTIDIEIDKKTHAIDTGFLVHNRVTYPNLIQLFDLLKTNIVDSDMSLSIQVEDLNFEWGGTNLNTVFGQRRNLFNLKFYFFLREIVNFNKNASRYLEWASEDKNRTLEDLLTKFKYSEQIRQWYLIPMAAAIWSTPADKILEFPAHTFLTFSINHHLLQVNDRPVWRTVKNGSRNYVKAITDLINDKRLNQKVTEVFYKEDKVYISTNETKNEEFDLVVFASHADQTIKMIKDISTEQLSVLKNFKYEKNMAYVHSDETFLPKRSLLWSAWNYASSPASKNVSVSYLINKLQPLETKKCVIVTLNPHKAVDPAKTYRVIEYHHPLFDTAAINAQDQIATIQGKNNMYFAGAWGGYGFHEDGLKSAVKVAQKLDLTIPWNPVL
jgi:predicted NAD/FAD-binding protein